MKPQALVLAGVLTFYFAPQVQACFFLDFKCLWNENLSRGQDAPRTVKQLPAEQHDVSPAETKKALQDLLKSAPNDTNSTTPQPQTGWWNRGLNEAQEAA